MNRLILSALLLAVAIAVACTRNDGTPDPPVEQLIPCNPDAASDDPVACPASDGSAPG